MNIKQKKIPNCTKGNIEPKLAQFQKKNEINKFLDTTVYNKNTKSRQNTMHQKKNVKIAS